MRAVKCSLRGGTSFGARQPPRRAACASPSEEEHRARWPARRRLDLSHPGDGETRLTGKHSLRRGMGLAAVFVLAAACTSPAAVSPSASAPAAASASAPAASSSGAPSGSAAADLTKLIADAKAEGT